LKEALKSHEFGVNDGANPWPGEMVNLIPETKPKSGIWADSGGGGGKKCEKMIDQKTREEKKTICGTPGYRQETGGVGQNMNP